MELQELQREVKVWCDYNFGSQPSWRPLLGLQEEVGELSHSYLKREQGIRNHDHKEAMKDAVADIIIYLADFCNIEGINMDTTLSQVWEEVKKRDWKKFPKNGRSE